jgi:hypothetical protein
MIHVVTRTVGEDEVHESALFFGRLAIARGFEAPSVA